MVRSEVYELLDDCLFAFTMDMLPLRYYSTIHIINTIATDPYNQTRQIREQDTEVWNKARLLLASLEAGQVLTSRYYSWGSAVSHLETRATRGCEPKLDWSS